MLGIIVDDLVPSQLSFSVIDQCNRGGHHLFVKTLSRSPVKLTCPMMDISEIWGFDGTLIATSVDTYRFLQNAPTGNKKLFYVFDLCQLKNMNFMERSRIEMPMIARANHHIDKIFHLTGKVATLQSQEFSFYE